MATRKRTVLLYGRSRAGKSSLGGELAEHVYRTEGKRTRLYTVDKGGLDPLLPHIDVGIVEPIEIGDTDPFVFLHKAVKGCVREGNKWVPGKNDDIGMFMFESMTSFADLLMNALILRAAEGVSIGGSGNISIAVQGDGESMKIGGSNMAMYGIVQSRVVNELWESQKLQASYILWTASASKDEDPNASGKVIGPAVIGKALTAEVLRWFQLAFRIDCLPAQNNKPERHILYLGNSVDVGAGNATGLGNTRTPLGSPDLPNQIEPASLVKAIQLIDNAQKASTDALKKRLNVS